MPLRAIARVNLAAVQRNVAVLRGRLTDGAALCAVVKADGYGHGAAAVAAAALDGGASWLAVATAAEAAELRQAGFETQILIMGAISREELALAVEARADVAAWNETFITDLAAAAAEPIPVHVKLDTGMGRLGTRDLSEALRLAERVLDEPQLSLAGAMTHFATADGDLGFVATQLERFAPFVAELRRRVPGLVVHAANSAATLRVPASQYDLVRCGIAIYGGDPMNEDPSAHGLEPALELSSYVAAVKLAQPGDSAGYGRQFVAEHNTWIATVPIGYGDGIRRALTNNCDVLIEGTRYPLVGTVSMDNITVDLGASTDIKPGTEAVIIGCSGAAQQTAEDVARRFGTINYEVLCDISRRVPRAYHRDGEPVS